jgi:hypothetical protein
MNIPSVSDVIKENPDRIQEFVNAGKKRLMEEHMFKYGQSPKPGNKYELCSWEFSDTTKITKEFLEEVMQKLTQELVALGYLVTRGTYNHTNIYGQTYDKSPTLIIEVPVK